MKASNEKAFKVDMHNCLLDFCVRLESEELLRSYLGGSYAFGPSKISIQSDKKLLQKDFEGFDGTFDPETQRFYLSKKESPFEYLIDMKEKKVLKFPRS